MTTCYRRNSRLLSFATHVNDIPIAAVHLRLDFHPYSHTFNVLWAYSCIVKVYYGSFHRLVENPKKYELIPSLTAKLNQKVMITSITKIALQGGSWWIYNGNVYDISKKNNSSCKTMTHCSRNHYRVDVLSIKTDMKIWKQQIPKIGMILLKWWFGWFKWMILKI